MLPDIVAEWLEKAEEDYGFACAGIEHTKYYAQICFHFQQAAEKFLKAFIVAGRLDFRPVHSLFELLAVCRQADVDAQRMEEAC
jgi:HEPN domain-containing protein